MVREVIADNFANLKTFSIAIRAAKQCNLISAFRRNSHEGNYCETHKVILMGPYLSESCQK